MISRDSGIRRPRIRITVVDEQADRRPRRRGRRVAYKDVLIDNSSPETITFHGEDKRRVAGRYNDHRESSTGSAGLWPSEGADCSRQE